MSSEWRETRLGDISDINYGYTAKASFEVDGPKFLRITDIQNGRVNWNTVPSCPITDSEYKKHKLDQNDIVFARTGATTGKSYLIKNIPPNSVAASYLIRLRLHDQSVLPEFVSLFFQTPDYWDMVNAGTSGSAQGGFNASKLSNLTLPKPSIQDQKRIVAILDEAFAGIDTAIANTEKNLTNARELFESYLDSVAHDKQPMGEFVTIKTGKLNANAAVVGGKYPFFTCSREIYEIDNYAFDCEAILLAGNNASGDFNVKHYAGKFNAYQRTYVITINETKSLSYRFLYFQLLKSLKELKRSSVGAGTKFLKLGMIQNLKISIPSMGMQEEVLNKLEFLMENSSHLESIYQQKINSLYELKQSLLQKTFSGELTMEGEKIMDEAVA